MDWKRLTASALMLGLLALPASAASITPQTTMKEIRDDPDIRASGLYTYTYVWERDCEKLSTSRDDETLAEVVDDKTNWPQNFSKKKKTTWRYLEKLMRFEV